MRALLDSVLSVVARVLTGVFFRSVEMSGSERIPRGVPLLIVANHVNSVVDPMLLMAFVDGRARMLAKSTLWSHPVMGPLLVLAGAVRVEDRQGAVRLGRYMIRCPIVLKRLNWETETGEAVCRGRLSRRGGSHGGEAHWDVLEFLARVVDHIPEPSQQTVRYWGYYANAARGKRRKAIGGRRRPGAA